MSLTSYRAAPSRGNFVCQRCGWAVISDVVNGFFRRNLGDLRFTRAAMPGDDLLFHRLSDSTIGAVWFHGRVRDGIGWFTDAIATRQWSPCGTSDDVRAQIFGFKSIPCTGWYLRAGDDHPIDDDALVYPELSLMVRLSSANRTISIG